MLSALDRLPRRISGPALAAALALSFAALACTGTDGRADTRTETPVAAEPIPPLPPAAFNATDGDPNTGTGTDSGSATATATDTGSETDAGSAATRPPPTATIELTFVGDIIFGRFRDTGYDPIPGPEDEPFALIKDTLKADIVVGNLETPVVRELPENSPIGSIFRFGAAADDVDFLVDAGFTALGLANNHAFDMRAKGMLETPAILKEKGLIALGASREEEPLHRLETIDRAGWRIGFIVVTSRRNAPDFDGAPRLPFTTSRDLEEHIAPLIDAAQTSHDAVFVVIHWGDEYEDAPAGYQQRYARALIDRGATAVIGHHPHVLQGIERYKHGAIAYSLGNFLFENTNEIPRQTGVLRIRLSPAERCVDQLVFHPAVIRRYPSPHPEPATKGMAKIVRRRVTELSKNLGKTTFTIEGEDMVLDGFDCPAVPIIPEPPPEAEGEGEGEADAKADGKVDAKADAGADGKVDPKADAKADAKADGTVDPKADAKPAVKPADKPAAPPAAAPAGTASPSSAKPSADR